MPISSPSNRLTSNRLVRAFGFSAKGLRAAWRDEAAFRQEVCVFAVLLPLTALLPLSACAKVVLVGQMALVLVCELMNSELEAIVDKASPERNELAAKAKDCASAAVLVACVTLAGCWLYMAAPAFWTLLLRML
ncbi:diacylglycerol kinase [Paraburkholderia sp. UCT31]|uniref:diacylglycerol kinase n=1 Tax=Paraburkholderia sp. UCT31 TaxID=2615209 RepID=UPI00165657E4|nr:diacylglycerol kinase [Paraburkholderia sp. UCT31]MBC8737100.1 diacylglycerol kinase [Paraburkholderia sp. UCT31]